MNNVFAIPQEAIHSGSLTFFIYNQAITITIRVLYNFNTNVINNKANSRILCCLSKGVFLLEVSIRIKVKRGISVVSPLASGARGPRFDPRSRRGKCRCPNTLSLVSFAGMTLDEYAVPRFGALTGCPLCRESHTLCRLKNPTII